ncbi:MAG: hypothetical protein WC373_15640, partial [Smithella sp.]
MLRSESKQNIIEPSFDNKIKEGKRVLGYSEAIREALQLAMNQDKRIFIMGQGVDDPDGMF